MSWNLALLVPGGAKRRQVQGGVLQGHRPGPEGGTCCSAHEGRSRGRCSQIPPTPARWASGARSAVSGLRLVSGPGCWVLPRYTHPYTHPLYPPVYPPCTVAASCTTPSGHPRTCTYDRFGHPVGEPRGMGTQPVYRVPAVKYSILWFTRPFDWVYACFIHCFTEFY